MTKLLNRIALFLSFMIGAMGAMVFGLFIGMGSGYGYSNGEELAMFVVIV